MRLLWRHAWIPSGSISPSPRPAPGGRLSRELDSQGGGSLVGVARDVPYAAGRRRAPEGRGRTAPGAKHCGETPKTFLNSRQKWEALAYFTCAAAALVE